MMAIAASGIAIHAEDRRPVDPNIVIVYVERGPAPNRDLSMAIKLAAKMFETAGVKIEWRFGTPSPCELEQDRPIMVRISANTPASERPGSLAYAFPYQGVEINVFYDRIVAAHPRFSYVILAHVLVHEMTHLLEGICRHSESGLMMAHWTLKDYSKMLHKPFAFSAYDIDLIRAGLAGRASRLGPLLADSCWPARLSSEEVPK